MAETQKKYVTHDREWNPAAKAVAEREPLSWRKPATVRVKHDLFANPDDAFTDAVFAVMALTPQHTYQVLTAYPERMAEYLNLVPPNYDDRDEAVFQTAFEIGQKHNCVPDWSVWFIRYGRGGSALDWPLPNLFLGVPISNQQDADERIPHLLKIPAAVRFLSVEPLLGPVDLLTPAYGMVIGGVPCVDWVIVGGESGPGARPMHPAWARDIRDQCQAAGVPFLFKQHGEYLHESQWPNQGGFASERSNAAHRHEDDSYSYRVGKKAAGRLLDGREWNEFPTPIRKDLPHA